MGNALQIQTGAAVKTCAKCGEAKAHSDFQRESKSPDGRKSRCRQCRQRTGRDELHQQSLDLGRHLLQLSVEFSEFEDILNEAIDRTRKRGQIKKDSALAMVAQAIRYHGCTSVYDVCEETHLPEATALSCVSELLSTRRCTERPRGGKTEGARGAVEMLVFWSDRAEDHAFALAVTGISSESLFEEMLKIL